MLMLNRWVELRQFQVQQPKRCFRKHFVYPQYNSHPIYDRVTIMLIDPDDQEEPLLSVPEVLPKNRTVDSDRLAIL